MPQAFRSLPTVLVRRLGQAAGAATFGVAIDPNAVAQAQGLLEQLPPNVQSAMSTANQAITTAQPAFNLAAKMSSKESATELEVVGAVGAAAGLINPMAGAAVVAIGTIAVEFQNLLQGVFAALGLYDPPKPDDVFNGLLRVNETVPYAPVDDGSGNFVYDPIWMHIDTWLNLQNTLWYGQGTHPAMESGGFPGGGDNGGELTTHTYKEQSLEGLFSMALFTQMTALQQWGWANASYVNPNASWPKHNMAPADASKLDPSKPRAPAAGWAKFYTIDRFGQDSGFEAFFNRMLLTNLRYWANGQAFVPLRTLLYGAASAWNQSHLGPYASGAPCNPSVAKGSSICYAPLDSMDQSDSRVQAYAKDQGRIMGWEAGGNTTGGMWVPAGTTVELILGPVGAFADPSTTLRNAPPLGINTGAYVPTASAVLTTTAMVAAVPAAAVAGSIVYSLALGKAWDHLLVNAWNDVKAFFRV